MAKADLSGYVPEPVGQPKTVEELARYVHQELLRASAVIAAGIARKVEFLNAEPSRREEGMTVGADGTNWNPGAGGKGVYTFYNNAWNKLG